MGKGIGARHFFAFAGLGAGFVGALFTILAYFVLAPQISAMGSDLDERFSDLDLLLVSAQDIGSQTGDTLQGPPREMLGNFHEALFIYSRSADDLALVFDGASPLLSMGGVGGLGEVSTRLRSSATSMRDAAYNADSLSDSLNSTSQEIGELTVQLGEYRKSVASSRSQMAATFRALQTAYILLTLAILAGFVTLMLLCAAFIFEEY
ncbi:MAG: hypothetical protein WC759_02140 [Candidatus Micrarchaeia archaeon]|jgi:hypothetical protein